MGRGEHGATIDKEEVAAWREQGNGAGLLQFMGDEGGGFESCKQALHPLWDEESSEQGLIETKLHPLWDEESSEQGLIKKEYQTR